MKKIWRLIVCLVLLISIGGCAGGAEESIGNVSQTALQNVSHAIFQVFGEEVDVSQLQYADRDGDFDLVYLGSEDNPSHYGYTERGTGAVVHVAKTFKATLTAEQQEEAAAYCAMLQADDADLHAKSSEQVEDKIATACAPVVTALVTGEFANGRTVLEWQYSFITTDNIIEPCMHVGICVHMSEGECYTVTVAWPQLEIIAFSFYPDGWESCVLG